MEGWNLPSYKWGSIIYLMMYYLLLYDYQFRPYKRSNCDMFSLHPCSRCYPLPSAGKDLVLRQNGSYLKYSKYGAFTLYSSRIIDDDLSGPKHVVGAITKTVLCDGNPSTFICQEYKFWSSLECRASSPDNDVFLKRRNEIIKNYRIKISVQCLLPIYVCVLQNISWILYYLFSLIKIGASKNCSIL
jgi:hypothetical protein